MPDEMLLPALSQRFCLVTREQASMWSAAEQAESFIQPLVIYCCCCCAFGYIVLKYTYKYDLYCKSVSLFRSGATAGSVRFSTPTDDR